MFKLIALAAIGFYQRHLSPRKGFSCAYRTHTSGMGCSGFGKHAISKHGLLLGLVLLHRRFAKCAWHAHSKTPPRRVYRGELGPFGRQAGFADCDVGGCDGPDCSGPDCDMPKFGCCGSAARSGAADSCWVFGEICSSSSSNTSRKNRSCAGSDCCNSSSGTSREEKRLARVKKRREQAKKKSSKDSDDGFDGFDGADGSGD